jgi:hypothetical protein
MKTFTYQMNVSYNTDFKIILEIEQYNFLEPFLELFICYVIADHIIC